MSDTNGGAGISLKSASQVVDRRAFPAASTIFTEGDVGGTAFILLRGDVSIYAGYGGQNQRKLTDLRTGQMFGELALMAHDRRTATAYTETGCELLVVSESKLKQKLDEADPFLRYWIEYLSRRVIDLSTPPQKDTSPVDGN